MSNRFPHHVSAGDRDFVAQMEAGALPEDRFDHRGHVRLAWVYLNAMPLGSATLHCGDTIRRYATGLGHANKYHMTLTQAFMAIIHHCLTHTPAGVDFEAFCARHPRLLDDPGALLRRHYSPERLGDERGRQAFLPPDLCPF